MLPACSEISIALSLEHRLTARQADQPSSTSRIASSSGVAA
jgi:hypothetical protein